MKKLLETAERELITTFGFSSLVSVGLFVVRVMSTGSTRYIFLIWNLLLAWVPLALIMLLSRKLERSLWSKGTNILLTLLWLAFLPNSFYLISDLMHLFTTSSARLLYDVVLLSSFAFNGIVLGFASVYMVHRRLLERLQWPTAHTLVGFVLFGCSFAIYLGRYLRWNTWDIFIKPAGLLFDLSDRLINPIAHQRTFTTTFTFFILLGTMYMVIWRLIRQLTHVQAKS